jgi:hypothetical protein
MTSKKRLSILLADDGSQHAQAAAAWLPSIQKEVEIGEIEHYYSHLSPAVFELCDSLKLGDQIHILGHTTDLIQKVSSMEIDYYFVLWVKPGRMWR